VASGGGRVRFSNSVGRISLSEPLPDLSGTLDIAGPGTNQLIVSGQNRTRVFSVSSSGNVTLSGLTIADGFATNDNGGGILNLGTLAISKCRIRNNQNARGIGGGIFTSGNLIMRDSIIESNSAYAALQSIFIPGSVFTEVRGGGLYIDGGAVTVSNCALLNNRVAGQSRGSDLCFPWPGPGQGGGFYLHGGSLTMLNCTVSGNKAVGAAGNSYHASTGCSGGDGFGGGGFLEQGNATFVGCTLSGNQAAGGPGVTGGIAALIGGSGGDGYGGAIAITNGILLLINSTLSSNTSQGGGGAAGGHYGGSGGDGAYGAIRMNGGRVQLIHCTVFGHLTVGGLGGLGQFPGQNGSRSINGIGREAGICEVLNTIVGDESPGVFASQGYNLFRFTNYITGLLASDLKNVSPLLGPLQDNGGPTLTHALLAGSPAIDAGTRGGITVDQRGRTRTADNPAIPNAAGGDGTDIGAVEVEHVLLGTEVRRADDDIHVRFTSASEKSYGLQYKPNMPGNAWIMLPGIVPGSGGIVTYTDTNAALQGRRFYRIFEQ
jgi:hypothetical protein